MQQTLPIEKRLDLHMHTVASDGELQPEDLIARCAAAGLSTIAVTDHNSMASVPRAAAACATQGIDLIPACEISTRWREREHHCLAYFVPLDDDVFRARIEGVRRADIDRSRQWVDSAAREGFPISWEMLEARCGADRVPPFSYLRQLLLEVTQGDSRMDPYRGEKPANLYGDWFARGKPLATEAPYQPSLVEAIAWVREAGGVPVLAHPGATLGDIEPEAAFVELRDAGLGGVEAWTTWHKEEQSERFATLATKVGLSVTAGADFHGPIVKPFVHNPGQVTHNGPDVLEGLEDARAALR
jgi:predicted metal-dependent phosphoesterase TrpH